MSAADRLTWPRRHDHGQPIVGWDCQHCGHRIERAYQPSLLTRCPECGGNQAGVRAFDVEPFVQQRRQRLHDQLRARYGPADVDEPTCAVCGAADPHIDPGEDLTDLEWRCDEHHRFGYRYWWQPGDHPSLLVRRWIETCDHCDAEFTGTFGVMFYFEHGPRQETEDICLRCADPDRVRRELDVEVDDAA